MARVHDLAVDKAAEHPVCVLHFFGDQVGPTGLDEAVKHHFGLLHKAFAAGQNVHGHDDADDQVLGYGHHIQYADGSTADDVLHGGQQGVLDPCVQIGIQGGVSELSSSMICSFFSMNSRWFAQYMNFVILACAV